MAHKKAGGSSRNGRDSESKRLGVKLFGSQHARAGNIIAEIRIRPQFPSGAPLESRLRCTQSPMFKTASFFRIAADFVMPPLEAFEEALRLLRRARGGRQASPVGRCGGLSRLVAAAEREAEALAAGHRVEAARVLEALHGALRPSMVAAVRRLRDAGLPLALLSNNVAPMERTGALGELLGLFDAVVESSTEGVRKPEPRFYEIACEELGIEPHEAVFLDDLGINLKPAKAMGMNQGGPIQRHMQLLFNTLDRETAERTLSERARANASRSLVDTATPVGIGDQLVVKPPRDRRVVEALLDQLPDPLVADIAARGGWLNG